VTPRQHIARFVWGLRADGWRLHYFYDVGSQRRVRQLELRRPGAPKGAHYSDILRVEAPAKGVWE
jgi:hypothetical protein